MKELKSIDNTPLNKCNSVFVKDYDGHDYCIHEDDYEDFQKLLSLSAEEDYDGVNFSEFLEKYENNMIGMCPYSFRKEYLFLPDSCY